MTRKPTTAAGYPPALAEEARGLCLYVATILGDLWDDVVVIGGLVPYLIVDQQRADIRRHVGTRDLDLGLSIAVLDEERYKEISQRLRERGFHPGANAAANPTHHTWGHSRRCRSPSRMPSSGRSMATLRPANGRNATSRCAARPPS